eukprot:6206472-Pleurochrysis_carterae.AAC.2
MIYDYVVPVATDIEDRDLYGAPRHIMTYNAHGNGPEDRRAMRVICCATSCARDQCNGMGTDNAAFK